MKLHIVSDLHLEFKDMSLPEVEAEYLILAGDIHLGDRAKDFIKRYVLRYKKIFYIAGNHEYYNNNLYSVTKALEVLQASIPNLQILQANSDFLDDETVIFGATLWTDMNREDPASIRTAQSYMNDFRIIKTSSERVFTAQESILIHKEHKRALLEALNNHNRVIVVTHHCPSYQSVHPMYLMKPEDRLMNGAFVSNLDNIIEQYTDKIPLWVHGHTHCSFNYKIENTRIVCNPRGYIPHEPNKEFDPGLVLKI